MSIYVYDMTRMKENLNGPHGECSSSAALGGANSCCVYVCVCVCLLKAPVWLGLFVFMVHICFAAAQYTLTQNSLPVWPFIQHDYFLLAASQPEAALQNSLLASRLLLLFRWTMTL